MTSRTVLVYGRSLLLAGVAAALEQEPDLTVVRTVACQEAECSRAVVVRGHEARSLTLNQITELVQGEDGP
jgi:hypothetical protein